MKKTLSIVLFVLLVFLAVACSPETHKHTWDDGEVTLAATCQSTGVTTYTCTVCGERDPRTTPKTDHKPIYKSGQCAEEDLGGVNCAESALYIFYCSDCAQTFTKLVTPAEAKSNGIDVPHAYYSSSDKKYVLYKNKEGADDADKARYGTDATDATMFTAKKSIAHCATCDAEMPIYNKIIETSGSAEFALMNGTWIYTRVNAEGEPVQKYFVDVVETKNADGTKNTAVASSSSSFDDETGWVTTKYETKNSKFNTSEGTRTLEIDEIYEVGEDSEGYTLKISGKDVISGTKNTIRFIPEHNHLYGGDTSDEGYKKSVWADSNFEKMKFLGQNLMDENVHYVSCSTCGLEYYPVEHRTSSNETVNGERVCTCGYTKNVDPKKGDVYCEVSVYTKTLEYSSDPLREAYNLNEKIQKLEKGETKAGEGNQQVSSEEAVTGSESLSDATCLSDEKKAIVTALKTLSEALNAALAYDEEDAGAAKSLEEAFGDSGSVSTAVGSECLTDETEIGEKYTAVKTAAGKATNSSYGLDVVSSGVPSAIDDLCGAILKALKKLSKENLDAALASNSGDLLNEADDFFVVKKGVILPVNFSSYTNSRGLKLNFVENTGWTALKGANIVSSGIQVNGDASVSCLAK